MSQRRAALLACILVGAAVAYLYWQLSGDELEGKYDEEGFLTVAWAVITGALAAALLIIVTRLALPDE